jgi:hypothetical protein
LGSASNGTTIGASGERSSHRAATQRRHGYKSRSLFTLAYAPIERPGAFYLTRIDAAINVSRAATSSLYAKLGNGNRRFYTAHAILHVTGTHFTPALPIL